jgi:hypothetical protein
MPLIVSLTLSYHRNSDTLFVGPTAFVEISQSLLNQP